MFRVNLFKILRIFIRKRRRFNFKAFLFVKANIIKCDIENYNNKKEKT